MKKRVPLNEMYAPLVCPKRFPKTLRSYDLTRRILITSTEDGCFNERVRSMPERRDYTAYSELLMQKGLMRQSRAARVIVELLLLFRKLVDSRMLYEQELTR